MAKIHIERSEDPVDRGVHKDVQVYPLNTMTYCAHCERLAEQQGNPKLQSRLQGRRGRYAHKEGILCGCTNRSTPGEQYESDFGRLIKLLTVQPDSQELMLELAIQTGKLQNAGQADVDPAAEKREAIALCKRRIDAAINLYSDGRISREEYLRRVEQNEREIAHWEARTTEMEKAALELAMCIDAVNKLSALWDMGEPEDRQGLAHSLFSKIVYDLDTRRIVSFKLKPWADRFLVLRAALYEEENPSLIEKNGGVSVLEPYARDTHPEGFQTISRDSVRLMIALFIRLLYPFPRVSTLPASNMIPVKVDRNREIFERFTSGTPAQTLANEFNISVRRVNRLINRFRLKGS